MKIVTVCGFGIGSSLILKISVEKALKQMNINGNVECTDKSTASGIMADVYLTSPLLAEELKLNVSKPVITINSFLDVSEIKLKLQQFI